MNPLLNSCKSGSTLLLLGRVIQILNSFLLSFCLLKRFGLQVVGTVAIALVAVTILSCVSPLGLNSQLPRLLRPRAEVTCIALFLQAMAALPALAFAMCFAHVEARQDAEWGTLASVAFGGYLTGALNVGLTLRIMNRSFSPGLLAPTLETIMLIVGAQVSNTAVGLVFWQLSGRVLGLLIVWIGLPFSYVPLPGVIGILNSSLRYTIPDVLAMISEQSASLLLGALVTRSDLGLFRLCQQFLTAADTPGWTFVQSKYPELVNATQDHAKHLEAQVSRLGISASLLCLVGSCAIATFAYKIPKLNLMMLILSASLVWRYKNNFFDQVLRATGRIGMSNALAIGKILLSLALFIPLITYFGVWGAVLALFVLSVASGATYSYAVKREVSAALIPRISA